MANPSTPYGFRCVGLQDGSVPNFGIYRGAGLNPATTDQTFQGDVLLPLSGGYFAPLAAVTPGGEEVGGVADGLFEWQSNTARMTLRQNWYPGNPADVVSGGGVGMSVANNPQAVFQVRSSGAAISQASVGRNINVSLGSGGNTLNGLSSMGVDPTTIGDDPSLPFKIVGIVQAPESDPTSANNEVLVTFNNLG